MSSCRAMRRLGCVARAQGEAVAGRDAPMEKGMLAALNGPRPAALTACTRST